MIAWGEGIRNNDPEYFCKLAIAPFSAKQVWIVTDARRKSDLAFFERNFANTKLIFVRITASKTTRIARGWQFVTGIDDAESECDLDEGLTWNVVINNDDSLGTYATNENILKLINIIKESYS
uniref:Phosphomevalonate kinase n=1 Tax=Phallusia mammillata TaxID=59560 RepID=A0A6F9DQ08_9ASCI|nr:phosphomevalonate kinase-like [Phallusia mammillata]